VPLRGKKDLSCGEWKKIIDQLHAGGTRRVTLLGGEPLIREDIGEIIRYIKGKGMSCGMTTNGYFVYKKLQDVLLLDTIAVSIDGDEAKTDYLRGKGTFQAVYEALEVLQNAGKRLLIDATIVKDNLDAVEAVLSIAERYRCQALINVAYHSSAINAPHIKELLMTDHQYRELFRQLIQAKKRGAPVFFSQKTYQALLYWNDYHKDKINNQEPLPVGFPRCQAGRCYAYIDTDGNMYPCPVNVGVVEALNCLDAGVEAAWKKTGTHSCRACTAACLIEYNALYSLQSYAIRNILRRY